eukprot:1129235-Karenia_brevis.AAC.1
MLASISVDKRSPNRRTPLLHNLTYLYGHRPCNAEVRYLSIFEFITYWRLELVTFPNCLRQVNSNYDFHADVTDCGLKKLEKQARGEGIADMKPGIDYAVKRERTACQDWLPFEDNEHTKHYCHNWVLARRNRPCDPTFISCPMPHP